ncbi:TPA: AAA family ATPase [Pseudomonas aeruginosa]|nr:AAA family ATPase [Pseudomonas aeruginosa]
MAINFKDLIKAKSVKAEEPKPEPKPELSFLQKMLEKKAALAEQAVAIPVSELAGLSPKEKDEVFKAKLEDGEACQAPDSSLSEAKATLSFLDRMKAARQASIEANRSAIKASSAKPTLEVGSNPELIRFGDIVLNDKQTKAVTYAREGQCFALTGAAGTGKTTAQAAVVQALEEQGAFSTHNFKYIGEKDSIAIVAFTKVAVRNIQKALKKNPATMKYVEHCMTIHSLLEYEPVIETRENDEGIDYEVRIFRPMRNACNRMGITHLIIEEASMVGVDLWMNLYAALNPGVQIIYLGDINQLQPVFGNPILAYALSKLPVIELTEVYRQALDNPIIANAHRVLKGLPFQTSPCGRVNLITGRAKVKVGMDHQGMALGGVMQKLFEAGQYDPEQDIILSAWNKKGCGVWAMNERIATFLGQARNALVYHIRAAMHEWYLAVGDLVLVDKRLGRIMAIEENPKYVGTVTKAPGAYTRDGTPLVGGKTEEVNLEDVDYTNFDLGDIKAANEDEDDESMTKRAASHSVFVAWEDQVDNFPDGIPRDMWHEMKSAGEFAKEKFQFAYCLTVHKSQGSEWRKVFLITHYDHSSMLSRELIYTALTRAKEEFSCFGKEDLIEKACARAEIKGNTLEDKIAYFTAKVTDFDSVPVEVDEDHKYLTPDLLTMAASLESNSAKPAVSYDWTANL